MLVIAILIFILIITLTIVSGGSTHLFTDTAFPTILVYVALPAFLLALVSAKANEKDSTPLKILRAIASPATAPAVVASFYRRFGKLAVMLGLIVFLINIMSLITNINHDTFASHFGVGIAHALMSVLVGLVIKTLCQVAVMRLS